jgi:hypothetical protein
MKFMDLFRGNHNKNIRSPITKLEIPISKDTRSEIKKEFLTSPISQEIHKNNEEREIYSGINYFSFLPVEIIHKIFNNLDTLDQLNTFKVCKQWHNCYLTYNNNLIQNINLVLNNNALNCDEKLDLSCESDFPSVYANSINYIFENDAAQPELFLKYLKNSNPLSNQLYLLPYLQSLTIYKTSLNSKVLIEFLREAPKIKSLSICYCDDLFMTGFLNYSTSFDTSSSSLNEENDKKLQLSNLSHLSLSKNRYLTDVILNFFTTAAPHLESLDMSCCNLSKKSTFITKDEKEK